MDEAPAILEYASAPPRQKSRFTLYVVLLVLANLVWAGQLTAVKYIDQQLGPLSMAFLPFFFVTPLMLPLLWISLNRPGVVRPTAGDWGKFAIAGIGGQLVCQLGMTWGSVKGQASSCSILYLLIPVITAVFASILLKERVTRLRMVCLGIGLAGVLLMSAQDVRNTALLESKFLLGNLLFFVGCIGASFYNVYCKGLMTRFPERDILIYSYITAIPASLIILLWQEPDCFSRLLQLNRPGWIAFSFNTLLVYGISMLMFFYVLQFLPVTVALASTYLVPVFGVIIAMILLGEKLTLFTVVGASVVLSATILIMKYDDIEG